MAKRVQFNRGDAATAGGIVLREGEPFVNTTNKSVHLGDGSTSGGIEQARSDLANSPAATASAAGKMSSAQVIALSTATTNIDDLQKTTRNYLALDIASANVTLSAVQLQNAAYLFFGTLSAARTVTFANAARPYIIRNGTSGAFTLTCKTASGTGVVIPQGQTRIIYSDGTNMQLAAGADADEVDFDNTASGLSATDVQAAIDEVDGDLDTLSATVAGFGDIVALDQTDVVRAATSTNITVGHTLSAAASANWTGTVTPSIAAGHQQSRALTGNTVLNAPNDTEEGSFDVILTVDATGGYSVDVTAYKTLSGAIDTAANTVNLLTINKYPNFSTLEVVQPPA